jgi:hypothetical protein
VLGLKRPSYQHLVCLCCMLMPACCRVLSLTRPSYQHLVCVAAFCLRAVACLARMGKLPAPGSCSMLAPGCFGDTLELPAPWWPTAPTTRCASTRICMQTWPEFAGICRENGAGGRTVTALP